jgi:hypothetical protein
MEGGAPAAYSRRHGLHARTRRALLTERCDSRICRIGIRSNFGGIQLIAEEAAHNAQGYENGALGTQTHAESNTREPPSRDRRAAHNRPAPAATKGESIHELHAASALSPTHLLQQHFQLRLGSGSQTANRQGEHTRRAQRQHSPWPTHCNAQRVSLGLGARAERDDSLPETRSDGVHHPLPTQRQSVHGQNQKRFTMFRQKFKFSLSVRFGRATAAAALGFVGALPGRASAAASATVATAKATLGTASSRAHTGRGARQTGCERSRVAKRWVDDVLRRSVERAKVSV